MESAVSGYMSSGEWSTATKSGAINLKNAANILMKVSETTWKSWYNSRSATDRETFNYYKHLVDTLYSAIENFNGNSQDNSTVNQAKEILQARKQTLPNRLQETVSETNPSEDTYNSGVGDNSNNDDENDDENSESTGALGNPNASAGHTTDEIINEAQGFINKGKNSDEITIDGDNLKAASNTLYNILLSVGIVVAVIIGVYLGAQFMMSSAEDRAKVKESIIPYIAGCVVIFGAFIIWKLAINLLGGIDNVAKNSYNIEYKMAQAVQEDIDFNIFSNKEKFKI